MNDRDCENCKHHKEVCKDGIFYHSCESWDCEFEPKDGYSISEPEGDKLCIDTHVSPIDPKFGMWIPVSEDLPKDAYGCFVTVMDVDLRTQNEFENILPYLVGYDGETWNNAGGEPIPYEVIAWMKAPEPYKAESEEEA